MRLRPPITPDIFRCLDHVLWRSNPEHTRAPSNEAGYTLKKVAQSSGHRIEVVDPMRHGRCGDVEPQLQRVGEIA